MLRWIASKLCTHRPSCSENASSLMGRVRARRRHANGRRDEWFERSWHKVVVGEPAAGLHDYAFCCDEMRSSSSELTEMGLGTHTRYWQLAEFEFGSVTLQPNALATPLTGLERFFVSSGVDWLFSPAMAQEWTYALPELHDYGLPLDLLDLVYTSAPLFCLGVYSACSTLGHIRLCHALSIYLMDPMYLTNVDAAFMSGVNRFQGAWLGLFWSFDPLLIGAELLMLGACMAFLTKFTDPAALAQRAYGALLIFCMRNNLSVTECALVVTSFAGLIFFDIFLTFMDDEISEISHWAVFAFIVGGCLGAIFIAGPALPFLVSNAIGEPTWRTWGMDIINNALYAIRVITGWFRYIFYDWQTDMLDMTLMYHEAENTGELGRTLDVFPALRSSETTAGLRPELEHLVEAGVFTLIAVFFDVVLVLLQIWMCGFKLFVATLLVWMLMDIFLFRPFAASESDGLAVARERSALERGKPRSIVTIWQRRRRSYDEMSCSFLSYGLGGARA